MARQLQKNGFEAVALVGGYDAWLAEFPVEPKEQGQVEIALTAR